MSKSPKKIILFSILIFTFTFCFLSFSHGRIQKIEATLTWSTNTYRPADYIGKALPIHYSPIEVVAQIDSPDINPQNLDFRWFLDGHLKEYVSGLGKNIFQFTTTKSNGSSHEIKLVLKDQTGNLLLEKYYSIKISSPEIVVYQTNPHLRALQYQTEIKSNQEIKLTALPYFFNIENLNELEYDWGFAGEKASQIAAKNPNILNLKIGQTNKEITEELKLNVANKTNSQERDSLNLDLIIQP